MVHKQSSLKKQRKKGWNLSQNPHLQVRLCPLLFSDYSVHLANHDKIMPYIKKNKLDRSKGAKTEYQNKIKFRLHHLQLKSISIIAVQSLSLIPLITMFCLWQICLYNGSKHLENIPAHSQIKTESLFSGWNN